MARRKNTDVMNPHNPLDAGVTTTRAEKNKRERAKSAASIKRTYRMGIRYGGDRARWLGLGALVIGAAALSVLSLVVALSKPSKASIESTVSAQLEAGGRSFPRGEAVMWAGQVLRVWGTWDEADPATRKVMLSPFLPQSMDDQGGWNGRGKQTLLYASINPEPVVTDANHALIGAVYQVQDGSWRCVTVPVYAYKPKDFSPNAPWAFTLSGTPVPSPCAGRTGAPIRDYAKAFPGTVANPDLAKDLSADFFPGFFAAWAASDANALRQYTTSGVTTLGLGGAVASVPAPLIKDAVIYTPEKGAVEGATYTAAVPVTWTVTGTTSQITGVYQVPMVKKGDRWYVAGEPTAIPQAPGVGSTDAATIPEAEVGMSGFGMYSTPSPTTGAPSEAPLTSPSAAPSASPSASPSATASTPTG